MGVLAALPKRACCTRVIGCCPYCWECETPLSNFEIRQDNSYRSRQDPAVTVAFELVRPGDGRPADELWATGQPVRAPGMDHYTMDVALQPGPGGGAEISYAVLESGGARYLVAESTPSMPSGLPSRPALAGAERVGTVDGRQLVGLTYRPLFDFFASQPNAFQVLGPEFVSTEEGTGIVHLAPGFGEDDQRACEQAGIDVVCPVDSRGRFTAEVPPYEGLQVFEANRPVIADLRQKGALVYHETYEHSYPHCWRTDTPLIYRPSVPGSSK